MRLLEALAQVIGFWKHRVCSRDRERQRAILNVVQEFLGGALGERGEVPQLVDERVGCGFELAVGHTVGGDAPIARLAPGDPSRAHDDVLGSGDADHLLQASRTARARDMAKALLGQRIGAGLRDEAEIAGIEGKLLRDRARAMSGIFAKSISNLSRKNSQSDELVTL